MKRIFILIGMFSTFIILMSLIIVGFQYRQIKNLPDFFINSKNIISKERYADKIKVYITKENRVEEIPIEDYVAGVVAGEMPANFSEEALKAQAVAARTFALAHMEQYGGIKYKSNTGADVCDTPKCQVFMPKQERMEKWPLKYGNTYWNKVVDASESTQGEILTYNGKLVKEPYYFSTSSGVTEDASEVFNSNIGYLKSVKSPGEEIAKKYKTSNTFSLKEFVLKVNSQYPKARLSIQNLSSQIKIEDRTEAGSVKQIKLGGITIAGTKFRMLMGLNSANFSISFSSSKVYIQCLGYGHDVGMSQWGANIMGKKGKNYKDILCHYYSGVKIEKISDIK
ncbi:stage II sporulation protein D [Clostridium tyrobutyricum]|uniref:stage II sporulation protein D n=1 Tax=Clostridium tyrobutyricum TaxID=1519 RepID=UPI00057EB3B5|nr:stage II sporulation protein D [Clostridium tyrobutyricum]